MGEAYAMRLAVIGGGAAAVSLLDSALRRFEGEERRCDITVYEGSANLATGRAYRPDLDCALVNREAGYMSVRSADRGHFLRWLHRAPRYRDTSYASLPVDSYVPRRVYGEYLTAHLESCRAEAERRGWTVRVVPEFAVEAKATAGDVMVRSARGVGHFDRVVLCLGTGAPADPYRLAGAPGFHPDPYPLRAVLPEIAADAHVLVLGSGLSGVDVALGLLRSGHRGPITMTSRHGLLPGVRATQPPYSLRHLTPEAVRQRVARDGALRARDTWRLLRAELTAAGVDLRALAADRPAAERLREDLSRLGGNACQAAVSAMMHQVREPVWCAMSDTDRRLFLSRFHAFSKPLYNPMPPPTARTLLDAMDSGQLAVRSRTTSVTARAGGGFTLEDGGGRLTRVDTVVDATRSGLAGTGSRAEPFIDSLTGSGLAVRNPVGGVRIDVTSNALRAAAPEEDPRFFALGDIASGDLFYAGSMYMLNTRAEVITHTLARAAHAGG
ncbi:FAD/NAD(P)-binding protein [Streptomyces sp. RS10V-4]|uniref:FAD/NAD(P)-binding protein n=1 Tax=Streptomyces rhizoryzae TaxID=2932493 RepID=UPI002005B687|nr:FAD/NAD(P)-binding protein [Streptomyces rhizoryzae]MCK7626497.1 FAD/NAD(P)-binding protein [Streptomyces rhizoryzae]